VNLRAVIACCSCVVKKGARWAPHQSDTPSQNGPESDASSERSMTRRHAASCHVSRSARQVVTAKQAAEMAPLDSTDGCRRGTGLYLACSAAQPTVPVLCMPNASKYHQATLSCHQPWGCLLMWCVRVPIAPRRTRCGPSDDAAHRHCALRSSVATSSLCGPGSGPIRRAPWAPAAGPSVYQISRLRVYV
jgi:hypothetical protein